MCESVPEGKATVFGRSECECATGTSVIDRRLYVFREEGGIRDVCLSRGLGDVYKGQAVWY